MIQMNRNNNKRLNQLLESIHLSKAKRKTNTLGNITKKVQRKLQNLKSTKIKLKSQESPIKKMVKINKDLK